MKDFLTGLLTESGKIFASSTTRIAGHKQGGGNWVTEADLAVENYLIKTISSAYPSHFILAEESAQEFDPKSYSDIWIVDPLDGTTNATFGLPIYGTSVAYMHGGEVLYGAIYDLVNKKLFFGEKRKGSFGPDGKKLEITKRSLKNGLVCTGSPYTYENFLKGLPILSKVHASGARIVILGSAVIECMFVAENNLSLYYEIGLKAWDVAAAKLIIEEAGGLVTGFNGPLDIFHPDTFVCGSQPIVAEFKNLLAT
ncbi:hypothetical protein HY214_00275 [Candidatus Roizmanbacteria bacterium]|nr:hypothetical protein [Candidatus Roizmanbacteria bacterium]